MTLRSLTENENGGIPLHMMLSLRSIIPAHAGIQVCSGRINLDTRFRGYDGPRQSLFVLIFAQVFSKERTKVMKEDKAEKSFATELQRSQSNKNFDRKGTQRGGKRRGAIHRVHCRYPRRQTCRNTERWRFAVCSALT